MWLYTAIIPLLCLSLSRKFRDLYEIIAVKEKPQQEKRIGEQKKYVWDPYRFLSTTQAGVLGSEVENNGEITVECESAPGLFKFVKESIYLDVRNVLHCFMFHQKLNDYKKSAGLPFGFFLQRKKIGGELCKHSWLWKCKICFSDLEISV